MSRPTGIHAIFGGFLAGLAVPHEGGFAIALVEKIEDLVTILLLPIVRAYSYSRSRFVNGLQYVTSIVLCTFRPEDRSRIIEHWKSVGICNPSHRHCVLRQVHRVCWYSQVRWI
jgi:hypothetical protein